MAASAFASVASMLRNGKEVPVPNFGRQGTDGEIVKAVFYLTERHVFDGSLHRSSLFA